MNDVYILTIEHSSTYSAPDTHVDSVYSSEKKAWEQIEKRYKTLIKSLSKSSSSTILFAEFRGKSFILSYRTLLYNVVYVKYIIDKRAIH